MPVYKYFCPECEKRDEVRTSTVSSDHDPPECKDCECEMKRDFSSEGPPGIQFKGSGFHVNDYE